MVKIEDIEKRLHNVEQLIIRLTIRELDPDTLKKIGKEIKSWEN